MKQIRYIWQVSKEVHGRLLAIALVVMIYTVLNLISPLIFSFYIDSVLGSEPVTNPLFLFLIDLAGSAEVLRNNLWTGFVLILSVYCFVCLFQYLRGRLNAVVGETVTRNIRNELYDHLQHVHYSYHVKNKSGDLIQRCTSDVDQVRRFISSQYSEMVYSLCTALIASVLLFSIHQNLAKLAVVTMPILIVFAYWFFTKAQKIFRLSDESEGVLTDKLTESISGIRVIKAFNRELYEIERYDECNKDYLEKTFELLKQLGLYWSFSDLICYLQILIIVLAGTIMAHRGELSVGNLFVFISYESMILWPIRNLGRILADLGKLSVSIERLLEILEVPVESTDGKKIQIEGKIEFKDVCFGYENQPNVLNHVSFTIEKGQTVAILGPTGSGKSSMIHLISRLYDPISGEVLIDGVPTIELEKKNLRKQIGLVLQEPFLFSKTIEENIRIARKNASKEELHRAAKIASVHDVIEEFDAGYQTMIGEKGVTLSGGQKQRVAIARTIVNQTPILIFDDSLSAVDAQTDADIREALKSVSERCTTLIITQRINSAKDADLILVLEHGQITQSGTHESLMSADGLYKRVAEIQARGEE